MSKTPLCPKHKTPLLLNVKSIAFAGSAYSVCIGTCPKCTVKYISQQFMSCATITIDGQKYEHLHGLPSADGTPLQKAPETLPVPLKEQQRMDDIEQFFLTAEKDILRQEELDEAKKQNTSLQKQLEDYRKALTEVKDRYAAQISLLRFEHQEQLEQTIHALEEKHKEELDAMAISHQSRIARINKIHEGAIRKAQETAQTALENERRRTAALQRDNASLTKQVENLTKQLAAAKRPEKQIVFVDEKLYVCGGTIRCEKYNHRHEDVTGIIDTIKGAPVTMTVSHCKDCNLYYVRDMVFESYREKYGTLLGKFIRKTDGMSLGQMTGYGELAPESILHMNGYNVNQTANLSPKERQKILTYIIESGIMNKHDIRNHLSYLIKMNQSNPTKQTAVSRWRTDIQWVNDYHAGKQDIVWLSGTAMYKFWRK